MRYNAEEDELLRSLVARDVSNIYWDPAKKARHLQLSRDGLSLREAGIQLGKSYRGIVARGCRSRGS